MEMYHNSYFEVLKRIHYYNNNNTNSSSKNNNNNNTVLKFLESLKVASSS